MIFAALFLLVLVQLGPHALASPEEDRIDTLPGFGPLGDFPWYSGHLSYELDGHVISTHYVYAKQNTTVEPESNKLIFWSNGGPGASSLMGFFTEVGPVMVNDNSLTTAEYLSTGVPTLFSNPTG